jgi:hypothetical protein
MANTNLSDKEKVAFVKSLDLDAIIHWCKEHNELSWLEAKMNETVTREYYGYLKVKDPKTGKMVCAKDEYGKRIIDRSKPPRRKTAAIGFMEIKRDFIDKFMPELRVEKEESDTLTMKEKLAAALKEAKAANG